MNPSSQLLKDAANEIDATANALKEGATLGDYWHSIDDMLVHGRLIFLSQDLHRAAMFADDFSVNAFLSFGC